MAEFLIFWDIHTRVDPRNKPAEEILIFLKIQDGPQNFDSKITFQLGKCIPFI